MSRAPWPIVSLISALAATAARAERAAAIRQKLSNPGNEREGISSGKR